MGHAQFPPTPCSCAGRRNSLDNALLPRMPPASKSGPSTWSPDGSGHQFSISSPSNSALSTYDEGQADEGPYAAQDLIKIGATVANQRAVGARAGNPEPLKDAPAPAKPLRILVAEDNKINQKVVVKVLKQVSSDVLKS